MIDFNPFEISFENIDRYYIKKSLFKYVISKRDFLKGDILDIGCGEMPYRKSILENPSVNSYSGVDLIGGTEYHKEIKPDFYWDGIKLPFSNDSFDSAIATEVLEHCPEPQITLCEIFRVLKPGSPLVLTVPFIWPTHESPYDYYRYTPFGLKYQLEKVGFESIEVSGLGGWDASLAQILSLWLKRRKMNKLKQKLIYYLISPVIKLLLKKDRILSPTSDQNLITSLGVIAWKK